MNQNLVKTLRKLCDEDRYDEAVATIERERPTEGCCADLLVWKARCLQLGAHATPEQVEHTLRDAIACDEHNASAWVELGWLLLNVLDRPQEAERTFRRALAIQAKTNTEVLVGLVKCLKEINPERSRDELEQSLHAGLVNDEEFYAALSE